MLLKMKFKLTQNVTNTFKLTLFRICITEMKLILIQLAINILFLLRYYIKQSVLPVQTRPGTIPTLEWKDES